LIRGRKVIVLDGLLILLFLISISAPLVWANDTPILVGSGPYVEELYYEHIISDSEQAAALLSNDIDIAESRISTEWANTLDESENIEVTRALTGTLGNFIINTAKYPFNITTFRRAIAMALDKNFITNDIMGESSLPQDSPIPQSNPLSIEGSNSYSYYHENIELANTMLDDAGFVYNEATGFRDAPDGTLFNITVHADINYDFVAEIQDYMISTLRALNIHVIDHDCICWHCCVLYRLQFHGDYDMTFLRRTVTPKSVQFHMEDFSSALSNESYRNYPSFQNTTYDYYLDQYLHATDHDSALSALQELQRILTFECPIIPLYEEYTYRAYRTDRFTNHANDTMLGSSSWWTNYQVQIKEPEGPFGGTFRWGAWVDLEQVNPLDPWHLPEGQFYMNLFDSLVRKSPSGEFIPWVANDFVVETHEDNPIVSEGRTRISFEIRNDFVWSDGTSLSIEDIIVTLNFLRDYPNSFYGRDLTNLTTISMTSLLSFYVEFSTESYWHVENVGSIPILPKAVIEGIDVENIYEWYLDPFDEDFKSSGPFLISNYVEYEFIELEVNPDFPFLHDSGSTYPTTNSTTTDTNTNELPLSVIFSISVTSIAVIVIVVVAYLWKSKTA
jgi:peptide/nickel transport system substrate-binding protein